ncbi:MAG: polysaccharide deacetylase family protein, partial [Clostridia bacterium]|nr:polysaccharide deacetylase family protein [Clostridia bacterium]
MYVSLRLSKILTLLAVIVAVSFMCFTFVLRQEQPVINNITPVKIAVVMYHGLIDDTSKQNKYFIDPKYFEEDLKYLNENGFQTIFASELINHFEKNTPLPEKPVLLTFDDGYYNNYTFAYPLLKKYNCKAVISPIGYPADEAVKETKQNTFYSQCTWKQLKEMSDSGLVEIQNHTYNLHHIDNGRNGAKNNTDESFEAYKKLLSDDLLKFNQRMFEE